MSTGFWTVVHLVNRGLEVFTRAKCTGTVSNVWLKVFYFHSVAIHQRTRLVLANCWAILTLKMKIIENALG